jgi:hypothetical protein
VTTYGRHFDGGKLVRKAEQPPKDDIEKMS